MKRFRDAMERARLFWQRIDTMGRTRAGSATQQTTERDGSPTESEVNAVRKAITTTRKNATFAASGDLPAPPWPLTPFGELLRVAFKDRFITTADHPVLRKLRGEA